MKSCWKNPFQDLFLLSFSFHASFFGVSETLSLVAFDCFLGFGFLREALFFLTMIDPAIVRLRGMCEFSTVWNSTLSLGLCLFGALATGSLRSAIAPGVRVTGWLDGYFVGNGSLHYLHRVRVWVRPGLSLGCSHTILKIKQSIIRPT